MKLNTFCVHRINILHSASILCWGRDRCGLYNNPLYVYIGVFVYLHVNEIHCTIAHPMQYISIQYFDLEQTFQQWLFRACTSSNAFMYISHSQENNKLLCVENGCVQQRSGRVCTTLDPRGILLHHNCVYWYCIVSKLLNIVGYFQYR